MIFNLLWWSIMINFRWNSVIPKRFDFILLLFLLKVSDFETGWFISLLVQKFSSTLLCSLFPQLTFFYKSSKHWILYLYALVSFWIGCNESGRYLIVDPRKSDKALPIGFSSPRCNTNTSQELNANVRVIKFVYVIRFWVGRDGQVFFNPSKVKVIQNSRSKK